MSIVKRFTNYLMLFGLGGLLLMACNIGTAPSEVALDSTATNTTPESNTSLLGGDTQTYTDRVVGFAFDFPAAWHILDSVEGGSVIIASFPISEPGTKETSEGVPADQSKMDFILLPEGTTLESSNRDQHNQEGGTVTQEENLTLPGGFKAVRLVVTSSMAGDVPVLLVEINSRILLVAGYSDTSLFDAITGTLRLTA